ncbi:hypothetical protein PoB_005861200 [Plakobranchus ocellatus]|uniref:Uncharacterized protein n=1 Tax=Plakobranchus ocellatus TaxID=259542 RepID=A0AAV4CKM5_9GAST|nr:hypothetical protein PoB_005861200 [Plakobranchus ocellatus]
MNILSIILTTLVLSYIHDDLCTVSCAPVVVKSGQIMDKTSVNQPALSIVPDIASEQNMDTANQNQRLISLSPDVTPAENMDTANENQLLTSLSPSVASAQRRHIALLLSSVSRQRAAGSKLFNKKQQVRVKRSFCEFVAMSCISSVLQLPLDMSKQWLGFL